MTIEVILMTIGDRAVVTIGDRVAEVVIVLGVGGRVVLLCIGQLALIAVGAVKFPLGLLTVKMFFVIIALRAMEADLILVGLMTEEGEGETLEGLKCIEQLAVIAEIAVKFPFGPLEQSPFFAAIALEEAEMTKEAVTEAVIEVVIEEGVMGRLAVVG